MKAWLLAGGVFASLVLIMSTIGVIVNFKRAIQCESDDDPVYEVSINRTANSALVWLLSASASAGSWYAFLN